MQARSLFEHISEASRSGKGIQIPDRQGAGEKRSYARLLEDAEGLAGGLEQLGVEPQGRVAVVARTSFDFIQTVLACWRIGAQPIPLPFPPRFLDRESRKRQIQQRVDAARPDVVISQDGDPEIHLAGHCLPLSDIVRGDPVASLPEIGDAALIQFTSGSTSDPRGIVLTHAALLAQIEGLRTRLGCDDPEADYGYVWLPLYHDLGFVASLLRSMVFGVSATFLPTDIFLTEPARWLIGMSETRATASAAPNFAFGLAARQIERGLPPGTDLSSIRFIANGGEASDERTVQRFLDAAEPLGFDPGALLPGYGLAESTCVVTVPELGHGARLDHVDRSALSSGEASSVAPSAETASFVSVGTPLDGVEVAIFGGSGDRLADRRIGEIATRGPSLMAGYLDDPAATAEVMRNGWLYTGDLGYMADGHLYVTGRAKDVIIVRGQNYYAEDIESVLQGVAGVRPGGSMALSLSQLGEEAFVVAAETKLTSAEELDGLLLEMKRALWSSAGIKAKEILVMPPGTLPKTTSGKLQRSLARDLYKDGVAHQVALRATGT